jgi:hypothetical protein
LGLRTRPESESVEKVVHWGFVYGDWSSRGLRERTNGFGSGERECGFRERIERFRERCGGDERRRDDEDLHYQSSNPDKTAASIAPGSFSLSSLVLKKFLH